MPAKPFNVKPPLGTPLDGSNPRVHGLVGAWDFLEYGGLVAFDSTQRYGNGAFNNAPVRTIVQGYQCIDFSQASSQQITIPHNPLYRLDKGASANPRFTIAALVRLKSLRNYNGIVTKSVGSFGDRFDLYMNAAGQWEIWASGNNNVQIGGIAAGVWIHVLLSVDFKSGTVPQWRYWLNGVNVRNDSTFGSASADTGNDIRIGNIAAGGCFMDGQIASFRLWDRSLSSAEAIAEYQNPWSVYKRRTWVAVSVGASDQIVSPDSILTAESWGTAAVSEDQIVAPDSILTAEAWGTVLVAGPQTVSPDFIPSGEDWGTPNVAGPVNPDSIPSGESWGTVEINAAQTVDAGTIASGESWGTPRASHVTTVRPDSIPSAESWGTPELTGSVRPVLAGSIESGESWGSPTIIGGVQSLQIFIGGYDRTRWLKRGTARLASQTLGRWSGSCTFLNTPSGDPRWIDTALEWVPLRGQTVLIKEFGETIFRGCIKNQKISRELDTDLLFVECTLGDKSSICDRRVIRKSYPDVSQGLTQWDIADVIRDIVTNYLDGEGITLDPALPAALGDLTAPLSPFITVTQAFDNLFNITGLNWFIDKNQTLFFRDSGDAEAAPFTITETSRNWRNLTTTISDDDYRNRQFVVSNAKIVPGANGGGSGGGVPSKTESYTMIDSGTGDPVIPDHTGLQNLATPPGYVYVNFAISSVVSIKVNGVAKTVYAMEDLTSDILFGIDQSWWTFFRGAANNSFVEGRSYPAPGDVIEVEYIPASDALQAAVSTDDVLAIEVPFDPPLGEQFGTCGSGRYDAVEQVNDITTAEGIDSIAAGLLNRSGIIPKQADFETDQPGLQVGQLLQVNVPRQQLNDGAGPLAMFITQLNGASNPDGEDLGFRSSFRWQVTAMNLPDVGNWIKTWERLWRRTQHPVPLDRPVAATIVLGSGGALLAGATINPYPLLETGQLAEIVGIFEAPPVDQDLVLDLRINGVTILDSAKFVIPDGTATLVRLTAFANLAVWLRKDDILTVRVSYRVTGPNPVPARAGVVSLRTVS